MIEKVEAERHYNQNMESFYNMIIKINSMDQLFKDGWKIIRKNNKKDYLSTDKAVSVVSVLGNKNSGKSFILHLLTGKDIPNGFSVTTEGLSLIVPDNEKNKNDNFVLIDTAGTESPLLNGTMEKFTMENINKKAKDRQMTDYFLQKFIYENSDIFICVVGNLTMTDQKFINRIIKNYTSKTIYIIHNLKTFINIDQVKNYIDKTLTQSITFELEKDEYYDFDGIEEDLKKENQIYYKQKLKKNNDRDESLKDDRVIIHLIIANADSEAGKYYNKSTIRYLNRQLLQVKEKNQFDIIKSLKDFLISVSGEIFYKKLEPDSLICENDVIKVNKIDLENNGNIKINNDEKDKILQKNELDLKDCSIDELGNNIIIDTQFKPKYRCGYFIDSNTQFKKFFMEIELFGNWKITQKIIIGEYSFFTIHIEGKKEKDIVRKEEDYECKNYIPGNSFVLEVNIDKSKGIVNNNPEAEMDNGLYILIYSLMESHIEEEIVSAESEEDD